ncbi:MAG: CoA pyrophosphatase [SAR202 cluster bacterium]|nr:CoA pyrophosphatase [SAR202 cluster bacterium]
MGFAKQGMAERLALLLAGRVPRMDAPDNSRPAGVLVPLYVRDDAWHVLLNVRSHHVGQHKGEIAFPGGRLEPDDADMVTCALREAHEEMGIRPGDVQVLGQLDGVYTRTGYMVWPIVGVIPYPYSFVADRREVAEVIEAPLGALLDASAVRHETRLQPDGTLLRRRAFAHGRHLIFGATAVMLDQLLGYVSQAMDASLEAEG